MLCLSKDSKYNEKRDCNISRCLPFDIDREELVTNPEFEVPEGQFQSDLDFLFLSDEELMILLGRPDPVKYTIRWSTLLHSERPKLYTILAFLSAVGLNQSSR